MPRWRRRELPASLGKPRDEAAPPIPSDTTAADSGPFGVSQTLEGLGTLLGLGYFHFIKEMLLHPIDPSLDGHILLLGSQDLAEGREEPP